MSVKNVLLIAVVSGISMLGGNAAADEMGGAPVTGKPVAKTFGGDSFVTGAKRRALRAVDLASPDSATLADAQKRRNDRFKRGQPLEIGFPRKVARARIDLGGLDWEPLPGGAQGARFTLTSNAAAALRAGLRLGSAKGAHADPSKVTLRFAGADGRIFADNGSAFAGDDMGWSPVISGDTITVEIVLPKSARPSDYTLSAPMFSHLQVDPSASQPSFAKGVGDIGSSDYCEKDIVCRVKPSAEFLSASKSVARMVFTPRTGYTGYCSGTLLNNSNSPKRQLFWSAAHCISTQKVANTLQTYWLYDATGCDNDTLSDKAVTLTGGATLLHSHATRDTLLLELKSAPPSGAYYAGWNSSAIAANGTAIEGIHHPSGDLKKYSLGSVTALSSTIDGKKPLTKVAWTTGVTEGGSSGSGLFTISSTSGYQLRGGLYGGTSYCSAPSDPDYYSQLDGVWSSIKAYFSP
ncbi:serine protease [Lysobacter enzymogenes]|uniref:Endoproteinase ArgC n=1 Tax=Lysobacter enzymogenes TaxID=69 RepID=A0AAU9AZM4_LYSEN|nr:serine protease [Lysobacter enzymogenes]BAV99939.1 endoproteinase ArgC [Lysobacter enzymogenes]